MKLLIITEFKRNLSSLILWASIIILLAILMLSLFPAFEGAFSQLEDLLAIYPEGFLKAFGLGEGQLDMSTAYGWFGTEGYLFVTLIGGSYAGILGSSILAKEEDDKTIEFLLSKPISRNKILLGKALVVIINLIVLNVLLGIGLIIVFAILKELDFVTTMLLVIGPFILELIFASLSFMISVFITKSRKVMSISLGLVIGFYALEIIANVSDNMNFLKYFTPYEYVNAVMIIKENKIELLYLLLSFGIILVSGFVAWRFYTKKDITI